MPAAGRARRGSISSCSDRRAEDAVRIEVVAARARMSLVSRAPPAQPGDEQRARDESRERGLGQAERLSLRTLHTCARASPDADADASSATAIRNDQMSARGISKLMRTSPPLAP
jgi:hypothetical protein